MREFEFKQLETLEEKKQAYKDSGGLFQRDDNSPPSYASSLNIFLEAMTGGTNIVDGLEARKNIDIYDDEMMLVYLNVFSEIQGNRSELIGLYYLMHPGRDFDLDVCYSLPENMKTIFDEYRKMFFFKHLAVMLMAQQWVNVALIQTKRFSTSTFCYISSDDLISIVIHTKKLWSSIVFDRRPLPVEPTRLTDFACLNGSRISFNMNCQLHDWLYDQLCQLGAMTIRKKALLDYIGQRSMQPEIIGSSLGQSRETKLLAAAQLYIGDSPCTIPFSYPWDTAIAARSGSLGRIAKLTEDPIESLACSSSLFSSETKRDHQLRTLTNKS